jgi:hypothetical protein
VAEKYRLPVGHIPFMPFHEKNYVKKEYSPLQVIIDMLRKERQAHGKRFVMGFRKGRLWITPFTRNPALYELGPTLIDAVFQETERNEQPFATALTVRNQASDDAGSHKHKNRSKHKHRKIAVKVQSPTGIKRYGYIHRIVYADGADSPAEAREMGHRYLSMLMKPQREITLTHPGMPFLRRGHALVVAVPQENFRTTVWIAELHHTLSPGAYDMDVSVVVDDPFKEKKPDHISETMDEVADTRKRKTKKKDTKKKKHTESDRHKQKKDGPAHIPKPPKKTLGEVLSGKGRPGPN